MTHERSKLGGILFFTVVFASMRNYIIAPQICWHTHTLCPTSLWTHTRLQIHAYVHTQTRTQTHTCIPHMHTHTQAHTHAHTMYSTPLYTDRRKIVFYSNVIRYLYVTRCYIMITAYYMYMYSIRKHVWYRFPRQRCATPLSGRLPVSVIPAALLV